MLVSCTTPSTMGNCLEHLKDQTPLISEVEAENENLRVFSFKKLKKATKYFRDEEVVLCEDDSVKIFYKCSIDETTLALSRNVTGIPVSVMECFQDYNSEQALRDWEEQVNYLGKISHPNLVKVFGYVCEGYKAYLVLERLHKGSLDRYIFGKEEEALPWEIRVKIATGTAQALALLHSVKNSVKYRKIKMFNIFLDEHYNAKYFHLESNPTRCSGRHDYLTGKDKQTELMGKDSDVYKFGLILLELLTGLKASHRVNKIRIFHDAAKPFLSDKSKIQEVVDPRLGNDYPVNAVLQMGKLIKRCITLDPMEPPSMQQVVHDLNDIAEIKD